MSKHRPPETEKDLIRAFDVLFSAVEPESTEEIEALLRAEGLDPKELAAQGRALVDEAIAKSPYNWRNRAPQERRRAGEKYGEIESAFPKTREAILSAISDFKLRMPEQYSLATAQYRNLEDVSDDDLQTLLGDLMYIWSQPSQGESNG